VEDALIASILFLYTALRMCHAECEMQVFIYNFPLSFFKNADPLLDLHLFYIILLFCLHFHAICAETRLFHSTVATAEHLPHRSQLQITIEYLQ